MIRYVLDTDHLSLFQRGPPTLTARLSATDPSLLAISIITAEEQLRGRFLQVRKFPKGPLCVTAYRQLRETIHDLNLLPILAFDEEAETIDQSLRQQRPRMDTQDRRIAAIALAHNTIQLTRNYKDFSLIPNLPIEDWTH